MSTGKETANAPTQPQPQPIDPATPGAPARALPGPARPRARPACRRAPPPPPPPPPPPRPPPRRRRPPARAFPRPPPPGALALPAGAQAAFPERPITLVVPTAAGGGNDGMARVVAQKMSALLGRTVIVENKAGAKGAIAAE